MGDRTIPALSLLAKFTAILMCFSMGGEERNRVGFAPNR
jgi:hypothetical protein